MCWRGHGQVRVGSFGVAGGRLCWSGNGLAMDTSVNSPPFTYYWPLPSAYTAQTLQQPQGYPIRSRLPRTVPHPRTNGHSRALARGRKEMGCCWQER